MGESVWQLQCPVVQLSMFPCVTPQPYLRPQKFRLTDKDIKDLLPVPPSENFYWEKKQKIELKAADIFAKCEAKHGKEALEACMAVMWPSNAYVSYMTLCKLEKQDPEAAALAREDALQKLQAKVEEATASLEAAKAAVEVAKDWGAK